MSLWDESGDSGLTVSERIGLISHIPNNHWMELYLMCSLPKRKAIAEGEGIADSISDFMTSIFPVYEAAVG